MAEGVEPVVEIEHTRPPIVERNVATADGAEPISGLALDRQREPLRREEFETLEPESPAQCIAYFVSKPWAATSSFATTAAASAVASAAHAEQALRL